MTYTTTQSRWNTRVLSSSRQRGIAATPQERDHVSSLLAKANAAGAGRPLTTHDTMRAMQAQADSARPETRR